MKLTESEHAKKCFQSPEFWAQEVCGITPTSQQKQMLDAIAYSGAHVAVASGHGIGKSTALALIALWFLSTRKDAMVPCTAPTAHQLEDILWFELRRMIDKMSPWMKDQFMVTKHEVSMVGSNGRILARTARPEKPDALQGFHNDNLLFILDEAAGIDEKVYEVAHGALSTPKARVIATGNPTEVSGFFHRIFHNDGERWSTFNFSSLDSPLVDPSYAETVKKDYGEDTDVYRVRVLGLFPLSGAKSVVPWELVTAALKRSVKDEEVAPYGAILGVDPAWDGGDRSVICLRQGRYAKILFAKPKVKGDELAREVGRFANIYQAQYIFVDKAGVGASCCDFLRTYGRKHVKVYFDMAPDDKQFFNKRAEMWWRIRQWMEQEDVTLINHEGLLEDLTAPTYGMKDTGRTYMESKEMMKKRGIRSPDLGDALALTFYLPYEVTARRRVGAERNTTGIVEAFRQEWRDMSFGKRRLIRA